MQRSFLAYLRLAVVATAVLYLAIYLGAAIVRLRYPYELEWMEGGMVDQVRWILAGHKLYVRPSIEFVPFLYNPLYFYICAGVAKIVGPGFFALRLVSLASSLGAFGLIYALVSLETDRRELGVIGAGLYAATFKETSQFMDLARVDSLFVLLILAPVYVLRTRPTIGGRAVAALLVVLAFWTKQSAVVIAATLGLHVLIEDRRRAWPFIAIVAVGIGGGVFVYDHIHDGWYWFFAFEVPSRHQYVRFMWGDFWAHDVMGRLGVACAGLLFLFIASDWEWSRRRLYFLGLIGALVASYLPRVKNGGWPNTLLPAYSFICMLAAMGLGKALAKLESISDSAARRIEAFVLVATTAQFAMLVYDPSTVVPRKRDREAGAALIAKIAATPGEVFMPTHSFYPVLANKRSYLHQQAVDDITWGGGAVSVMVSEEIADALRSKRFELVITDNDFFAADVRRNYFESEPAFKQEGVFYPVTGVHYRSGGLFRPKR